MQLNNTENTEIDSIPIIIDPHLERIRVKVEKGQRLTYDDARRLVNTNDLLGIGFLANIVRRRINANNAYFITNRHVNYTNICINRCKFCAFSKDIAAPDAYSMSIDDIISTIGSVTPKELSEVHIVGGLHPELPFSFYLDMLSSIRQAFPHIHIQAFTAVEIDHLRKISGLGLEETLHKLSIAGLGSIPGGGAEVFNPVTRKGICPEKITGERWLEIMKTAHKMGIKSNATMLYGHIETPYDWIDHLLKLRETQDETKGFMSFIPLAFHPKNTNFSYLSKTTAFLDLKILALSRLLLDNFQHIKAFWIMIGEKISQISLDFGVDDIDGTVIEERITHAAGAETGMYIRRDKIIGLIKTAGYKPIERDTVYNIIKTYEDA